MGKEFLDYYSSNLNFIRKLGAEFANEFPKIGARLDINALECQDPFIERLLEGTAFLTARIEKKLDEGHPRLLSSILQAISPNVLAPIPSGCVLKVSPTDLSALNGLFKKIPFGTQFKKTLSKVSTPVIFENFFETFLVPFSIRKTTLVKHNEDLAALSKHGSHTSLELSLERSVGADFQASQFEYVDFYINASEQDAANLCEQLFSNLESAFIKADDKYIKLSDLKIELSIFDAQSNLLNEINPSLNGINALATYMAYPDFFKFIRVKGLKEQLSKVTSQEISLVFLFEREFDALDNKIEDNTLLVNCIPVINLFKRRANRISVSQEYEVNINVDLTSPLDMEIFSIESLDFYNNYNQALFTAYPFFTAEAKDLTSNVYRNFFAVNRRFRQTGINGNKRSPYNKSEVFVSISGRDFSENMGEDMQVSANCYCTNADLPLFISQKDTLNTTDIKGISELKIVSPLTKPKAPLVMSGTKEDFTRLSFILLNLSSMLEGGNDECLFNLKQIVRAYSLKNADQTSRMVGALSKVEITDKIFRFISKGCVYFENGFNVAITFSQKKLEGVGICVYAKVIARLLNSFTQVNVPIDVDIYSDEKGRLFTCKMQKE